MFVKYYTFSCEDILYNITSMFYCFYTILCFLVVLKSLIYIYICLELHYSVVKSLYYMFIIIICKLLDIMGNYIGNFGSVE